MEKMKLFTITTPWVSGKIFSEDIYVICNNYGEAEKIFLSEYPNSSIWSIREISKNPMIKGIQ
jgi:hypothetical protein